MKLWILIYPSSHFDPLPASQLNTLVANDNALKDGTALDDGIITPDILATGASTSTVATSQDTISDTYTNLSTAGPAVTLNIGANGLALVIITAELSQNTSTNYAAMSFAVSGATTLAADNSRALYAKYNSTGNVNSDRFSFAILLTGLSPGSTTFTSKYRRIGGSGTATFTSRDINVIPL